jgi:RNA recognition motif-containing protein
MKLWLGNIAPGTSEEELRALLEKYGVAAVISVEHVATEGSRPAAMVEVALAPDAVSRLTQRLNGMYWKGRSLTVQAMTR